MEQPTRTARRPWRMLIALLVLAALAGAWSAAGVRMRARALDDHRGDYNKARWALLWPGGESLEAREFVAAFEALHDATPITALYCCWRLAQAAEALTSRSAQSPEPDRHQDASGQQD